MSQFHRCDVCGMEREVILAGLRLTRHKVEYTTDDKYLREYDICEECRVAIIDFMEPRRKEKQ